METKKLKMILNLTSDVFVDEVVNHAWFFNLIDDAVKEELNDKKMEIAKNTQVVITVEVEAVKK